MRSEPITPRTSRHQMSPKLPSSPTSQFLFYPLFQQVLACSNCFKALKRGGIPMPVGYVSGTRVHLPSPSPRVPPGPLHCIIREYTSGGSQSLRCGPSSTSSAHAHTSRAPASAVGKVPVGDTRGALPIQFVLTPVLKEKTKFNGTSHLLHFSQLNSKLSIRAQGPGVAIVRQE